MSRQTIAVSVKASKLTARALAYVVAAVGRKIAKEHRKAQTPHGKQSVRKLMGHGGDTNAIEVDTPKLFDKVARKWGVDYAIRRVGDEKYLLLFKARQADAITGCFAEYSRLELKRAKSRQTPIREQLRQAEEAAARYRAAQLLEKSNAQGRQNALCAPFREKASPSPSQRIEAGCEPFSADFCRTKEKAGRKKKQDKGMASQAPPQPSLLPAVRAVSDA